MLDSSPQTAFSHGRALAEARLDGVLSTEGPDERRARLRLLLEDWQRACEGLSSTPNLACEKGCWTCCRYPVGLTLREIDALLPALRQQLAGVDGPRLRERIERDHERFRESSWSDHAAAFHPCPLLDSEGGCRLYTVRPVGCRGWTSFSREQCEITASHKEPIPFESVRYYSALGIACALDHCPPHPGERFDLVAALHALLDVREEDAKSLSELRRTLFERGLRPLQA